MVFHEVTVARAKWPRDYTWQVLLPRLFESSGRQTPTSWPNWNRPHPPAPWVPPGCHQREQSVAVAPLLPTHCDLGPNLFFSLDRRWWKPLLSRRNSIFALFFFFRFLMHMSTPRSLPDCPPEFYPQLHEKMLRAFCEPPSTKSWQTTAIIQTISLN